MEPTYVKAAPAGPAHADATSTRSHTFTHCQELKFRGIVGCRLRGRRLVGRRLVGRFLGTEGNLEQGFQRFRVFETDIVPCAVHSTQLTRQASRRQEEEPRARQGDPTPHARAAHLHARARSASCARARPPAVGPRNIPPFPSHREHRAAHIRGRASRASCSSRARPPELSRRRRRSYCLRRAQHPTHTASVTRRQGGATRARQRDPTAARARPRPTAQARASLCIVHAPARGRSRP